MTSIENLEAKHKEFMDRLADSDERSSAKCAAIDRWLATLAEQKELRPFVLYPFDDVMLNEWNRIVEMRLQLYAVRDCLAKLVTIELVARLRAKCGRKAA